MKYNNSRIISFKKVSGSIIFLLTLLCMLFAFTVSIKAEEARIKDIATIYGIRENQLTGIGIVTGLDGDGDSDNALLLREVLANLLESFDISIDPEEIQSKNSAVVMVTADVPAYARPGERISITVSSIQDADNLNGGILLQTPLKAANGTTYAVAQGMITAARGRDAVTTVGRISGGALMEREVSSKFIEGKRVTILLKDPDFQTSHSVAEKINENFENADARPLDPARVEVKVPDSTNIGPVGFIAEIEQLTVSPDTEARVVIDPSTGIVVMGKNVKLGTVAVSYQGTKLSIGSTANRFSQNEQKNNFVINETANVQDLVNILQEVGVETDTIIGILQAVDRAGALYGKLIVM